MKKFDLNDAAQTADAVMSAMHAERSIYADFFEAHRERLLSLIVAMNADTVPKMTSVLLVHIMKNIPDFAIHLRAATAKPGYSQEAAVLDVMGDLVAVAGFLAGAEYFLFKEGNRAAEETVAPVQAPVPCRPAPDANGVITVSVPDPASHLVEGDQKLH